MDPDPNARVRSAWRTYRACLERVVELGEPAVILQDDTVACPCFAHAATVALDRRPGRLIAFFHSRHPSANVPFLLAACDHGRPFAEVRPGRWVPTVALAWPVELAAGFLEWIDHVRKRLPRHWHADDSLVGEWTAAAKRCPLITVPSLVEHPDDVPSVVPRGTRADIRSACLPIGDTPVSEWVALL